MAPFWNEVLKNPLWVFGTLIGIAAVLGAVAGIIFACRHRHPAWEQLHAEITNITGRQLDVFSTMIGIIERQDPTAAQRAETLTTYEDVNAWLAEIFQLRPRSRETIHFNTLLRYFTAEWWLWAKDIGLVTEEMVNALLQSNSTPRDVANHIRQQMEQALVLSTPAPNDPSALNLTDTAYMRVVTGEDLVDAAT